MNLERKPNFSYKPRGFFLAVFVFFCVVYKFVFLISVNDGKMKKKIRNVHINSDFLPEALSGALSLQSVVVFYL